MARTSRAAGAAVRAKVQSVDQDYLYDRPVMLGSQRVGPDLANIGRRQTNELAVAAAYLQSAIDHAQFRHAAIPLSV